MPTKAAQNPAALVLSPTDVERLLHDTTSNTRIEMSGRIGGAYGNNNLSAQETKAAEQIFRLLVRDTELRVRVALVENVKSSERIPYDIVMTLARDVEEVSLPVLQYSQVLSDDDLVDILKNTEEISRYLAVSKRENVSETVADTLLAKDNEKVAEALVENKGARISDQGIRKIVDTHSNNKKLMKSVSERPRLPAAAAEKLVHIVSSTLGQTLQNKYKLPAGQIEKEVDKAHEGETLGIIRHLHSAEEVEKLSSQLLLSNRLTPSIILSALCQGNFAFFETSLARLSNIPVANARALIHDRGDLGFRALYEKSGLSEVLFPAVKMLLKVVRELDEKGEKRGTKRYVNRVVEQLLKRSEETPVENLSYIIALVRRMAQ